MNKFGKKFNGLTEDAERALLEHRWTGNVRELKNMIERGTLIGTESFLTHADLGLENAKQLTSPGSNIPSPVLPPIPESGVDLASIEKRFEQYYIEEAYRMANGNESKAAKLLNINHHTYRYRRKKLLED
jgi:two-component system, NtrC family, response regulator AtoC